MDDNDTTRLERIRERARGMGLQIYYAGNSIYITTEKYGYISTIAKFPHSDVARQNEERYGLIESLLTALDPDAHVVPVGARCSRCPQWDDHLGIDGGCLQGWNKHFDGMSLCKPDLGKCIRPAPDGHEWVLVCRRKGGGDG